MQFGSNHRVKPLYQMPNLLDLPTSRIVRNTVVLLLNSADIGILL